MALKVLALNCTLKKSPEQSSTDRLLRELLAALKEYDATGEIVRVADLNIKPGVKSDEGAGDDWPALRQRILASNILISRLAHLARPAVEHRQARARANGCISRERDDMRRMPSYGIVGFAAVVGNEDGAHHVHAEVCQALCEVGFTIPSGGVTYWVGEAMGDKDYIDVKSPPKALVEWTPMLASNAAHLAKLLQQSNYPGHKKG